MNEAREVKSPRRTPRSHQNDTIGALERSFRRLKEQPAKMQVLLQRILKLTFANPNSPPGIEPLGAQPVTGCVRHYISCSSAATSAAAALA